MSYKSFVTGFHYGIHYCRIIKFLSFIKFMSARYSARMNMANVLMIFCYCLNDITFHYLHMVYVVK